MPWIRVSLISTQETQSTNNTPIWCPIPPLSWLPSTSYRIITQLQSTSVADAGPCLFPSRETALKGMMSFYFMLGFVDVTDFQPLLLLDTVPGWPSPLRCDDVPKRIFVPFSHSIDYAYHICSYQLRMEWNGMDDRYNVEFISIYWLLLFCSSKWRRYLHIYKKVGQEADFVYKEGLGPWSSCLTFHILFCFQIYYCPWL